MSTISMLVILGCAAAAAFLLWFAVAWIEKRMSRVLHAAIWGITEAKLWLKSYWNF